MTPLSSAAVLRDLLLARVASGFVSATDALIADIAQDIEETLRSGRELTEYQGRRLDRQIAELTDLVQIPTPDLGELATDEARWQAATLATVGVEAVLPASLAAVAESSLVQGATFGAWFAKLNTDTRFQIERTIKAGVATGKTNAQLAREILGIQREGERGPEPLKVARRNAAAVTRTAVATVSNQARLKLFERNEDVLEGVRQLSTLDGRTSLTCQSYSGKRWAFPEYTPIGHSLPFNGGPPRHFNCRSTLVPIVIGESLEGRTQSSAFGPVAADLTFEQWLKTQPRELTDDVLGKGRAELWKAGKISLTQLVDGRGRPLTLKELRERYQ